MMVKLERVINGNAIQERTYRGSLLIIPKFIEFFTLLLANPISKEFVGRYRDNCIKEMPLELDRLNCF